MKPVLYYIHDPMCSWCWGFRPVWTQVQQALANKVDIQYVLGGLATDTDQPMPESMQQTISETWKKIQAEIPGTEFNFDFWTSCKPRRSTYPACRAIIASRMQRPELEGKMLKAIQHAYYLHAKNPSDDEVLIALAADIGLDVKMFSNDLNSKICNKILFDEMDQVQELYVHSFPSLVLAQGRSSIPIKIQYTQYELNLQQIRAKLTAVSVR